MPRGYPKSKLGGAPSPAASEAPVAPAVKAKKSGAVVTVACKIPIGLVLQLCRRTTYMEDTPSGSRERVRFDKSGQRYVARGTAYPAIPPAGFPPRAPIVGGYALTPNIPADFWEAWAEQNADTPFIQNKMIFAYSSLADVKGEADECRGVRSGFEPLVPDNDPRVPKATAGVPGATGIETADEMKERLAAAVIDDSVLEDA